MVFVISVLLVVVAFVTLVLGVVGVGDGALRFVYVSIASCLLAALFLAVGVVRGRPSRKPVSTGGSALGPRPTWSGASHWPPPSGAASTTGSQAGAGEAHVQVVRQPDPPAASPVATAASGAPEEDSDDPAETRRFGSALTGLPLDAAKVERLRGRFVTLDALRAADPDALAAVPGISRELAERIHHRLRNGAG